MKAYTDLSQSKKLAEILPLESADLFYADFLVDGKHKYIIQSLKSYGYKTFVETKLKKSTHLDLVPSWSLAALLDILHDYTLQNNADGSVFVVCDSYKPMISDGYRNPVDACYEMILKLKEMNLL